VLKILIVDDMPIFLEYLRGCIEWESYGFYICGEAHDGREALKCIEELSPDIVLTDITMPYLDGLELSQKITDEYPDISVILITGNNEFDYARKAVRIGVCDYIVKPFEKEELLLSLLKLQDNISRALEAKSVKEEMGNQKRENVLRKLIHGRHTSWSGHLSQFEENGIIFGSDYFLVCTMKFEASRTVNLEGISNWENIIVQMLKNKIEIDGHFYVFRDFENNIVILLNFDNEPDMKDYKSYELTDLNKVVKDSLSIESSIGVSDYCYGLNSVRDGYIQSQQAIMSKTPETIGRIYDYKKINVSGNNEYYSWNAIDKLNRAIEMLDDEMVRTTIHEEVQVVESMNNEAMSIYIYSGLISVLLSSVINSGRSVEMVFGDNFRPYEEMKSLPNGETREQKLIDYYLKTIEFEKENKDSKSHQIVENIKAYVAEHYMEPELCISDISRDLLVNQTYLRSMFKAETNTTITEYITRYRMQLAKKLIRETDDKFVVIAEKTGFSDVGYFSKSFKKFYGISPKECRLPG